MAQTSLRGGDQDKKTGRSAKSGSANQKTDAIALLKADHRHVEELFQKYENARTKKEKRNLADKICNELIIHARIEEEIFYPACLEHGVSVDDLDEAQVEHDGAKLLILELLRGSPSDPYYDAKMTVLSEQIKHHVKEEEKRSEGIFALARDAGVDLARVGEELSNRKDELKKELAARGSPEPEPLSFTAWRVN